MGRLTVSGHDPLSLSQFSGDIEFVVMTLLDESEGDEWQTFLALGGHDLPVAGLLEGAGEIDGIARQVLHDASVSGLAEADQLVILRQHLRRSFGKVESKGGLISTEVVLVSSAIVADHVNDKLTIVKINSFGKKSGDRQTAQPIPG